MKPRLVLVLGDQLTPGLSALRTADRERDFVVMSEVAEEAGYVRHHVKKIAFLFAAMRKFSVELERAGWRVLYGRLDDPETAGSIPGELLRRAAGTGADEVLATECGEWRLRAAIAATPLTVTMLPDDRFICPRDAFAAWAEGRKTLRMEHFYREMRRRTGLLMEGGAPAVGQWNFDHENRKPARGDLFLPRPMRFEPDAVTAEVLDMVERRFPEHFGRLRPFWFATDRVGAEAAAEHFFAEALPGFGDRQDAMLTGERFLWHSVLSVYLNVGLLDPLDLCRRAEAEWRAGRVGLSGNGRSHHGNRYPRSDRGAAGSGRLPIGAPGQTSPAQRLFRRVFVLEPFRILRNILRYRRDASALFAWMGIHTLVLHFRLCFRRRDRPMGGWPAHGLFRRSQSAARFAATEV